MLGAAPAPLARFVVRAFTGPMGLTVAMRSGLRVYFGAASRPHAKWLSLVRVLADPSSAGASDVDVRLPERPAAGFPAGVTPPAASAAGVGSEQTGDEHAGVSEESTVAASLRSRPQPGRRGWDVNRHCRRTVEHRQRTRHGTVEHGQRIGEHRQ